MDYIGFAVVVAVVTWLWLRRRPAAVTQQPDVTEAEADDADDAWLKAHVTRLMSEVGLNQADFEITRLAGSPSGWMYMDYVDLRRGRVKREININEHSEAAMVSALRARLKRVANQGGRAPDVTT